MMPRESTHRPNGAHAPSPGGDPQDQFREYLIAHHIIPPAEIVDDGKIHVCDVEGKGGKRDGRYLYHSDGIPAGGCQNWKDGEGWHNFRADIGRPLTTAERDASDAQREETRRQYEADVAAGQAQAARTAAMTWGNAPPAAADHDYLRKKAIGPHGARLHDGKIVIPLRIGADIHSLQFIAQDGEKRFLKGGRTSGCYYSIGKPEGAAALVICEGFATGASINEATDYPVAVAFNCGNLSAVAKAMQQRFPGLRLIVFADDDHKTEGNPGVTKAREAAQAVGACFAIAKFGADRQDGDTDANDFVRMYGTEALRRCIAAAVVPDAPTPADTDRSAPAGCGVGDHLEVILVRGCDIEPGPDDAKAEAGGAKVAKKAKNGPQSHSLAGKPEAKNGEKWLRSALGAILDTDAQVLALKAAQAVLKWEAPAHAYPVEALGPLSDACAAIAREAQIDPAMAGQCVLATAALLAQSRATVRTLAGIKPLALYILTIADSGEGKTTAEETALRAIKRRQQGEAQAYREEVDRLARERKAKNSDAPTVPPRRPYRTVRDGTIEGIRREFNEGVPSQGVFTSEAATMLCGYGMKSENRMNTAGALSGLFDDGAISVSRAGAGRIELFDRRLTISWLVQPDAARNALLDPALSNLGFWPRFLLACPPQSEPKTAREFRAEDVPAVRTFWERCESLYAPLGDDCGGLPVIEATAEAHQIICQFFERMEVAKCAGGALEAIRPFAGRATEQIFRIAGVLATFDGRQIINTADARNAMQLAVYSLDTWLGTLGDREELDATADALALLAWILRQPGHSATAANILQTAMPRSLRSKTCRDGAIEKLRQGDLIRQAGNTFRAVLSDEP